MEESIDKGAFICLQSRRFADCPIATHTSTEQCSSSESGWTAYIASPDLEHDTTENEEDDLDIDGGAIAQQRYKKHTEVEEEAADSDDSMASDASSGPSDQRYSCGYHGRTHGFGHLKSNTEGKSIAKKHNQQEEKDKQIKGGKDKSGNKTHSGGRLKKF